MTSQFNAFIDQLWDSGADRYFTNLRALKLFRNKIAYSLHIVGEEVNFDDFVALELVRDIHPPLYDFIYSNGEFFYDPGMAFETWGKRIHPLDEEKARKARAEFYEELTQNVPQDKRYVFAIVGLLFPFFAEYKGGIAFRAPDEVDAEKERRIFHPRFFRQYFLFRVPPELFSQRQFKEFCSSITGVSAQDARKEFSATFKSLLKEEFKRWHFMHLIGGKILEFEVGVARGLCLGMAENSSPWTRDAFEFDIAIRSTYQTLKRLEDSPRRKDFLRKVIEVSSSALYALHLIWVVETSKDADRAIVADVQKMRSFAKDWMKSKYLAQSAPSVFDEFQTIDPIQVLFAWQRLGPEAQRDEREYLSLLFARDPSALDKLLKLMFRVEFIDDYTNLKPLYDYQELSKLIAHNAAALDPLMVQKFQEKFAEEPRLES